MHRNSTGVSLVQYVVFGCIVMVVVYCVCFGVQNAQNRRKMIYAHGFLVRFVFGFLVRMSSRRRNIVIDVVCMCTNMTGNFKSWKGY